MYPQLFNQAARLAPMLQRLLMRGGSFASPFWKTQQIDVPSVNAQPVPPQAQPTGPAPPISTPNLTTPTNTSAPSVPALGGLGLFPPASPQPSSWLQNAQRMPASAPTPMPNPPQTYAPPDPNRGHMTVPVPLARPPEAPQPDPQMSWFQRNAAMMQDPMTGQFIDPTAAAKAQQQVRGPDLINKMMAYLHNKDNG